MSRHLILTVAVSSLIILSACANKEIDFSDITSDTASVTMITTEGSTGIATDEDQDAKTELKIAPRNEEPRYAYIRYKHTYLSKGDSRRQSQKSITEVREINGKTVYQMQYEDGSPIDIATVTVKLNYVPEGVRRDPGDLSKYEKEGENKGISPMLIMLDQDGELTFPVKDVESGILVNIQGREGFILHKPNNYEYDKVAGIFFDEYDYLLIMYLGSDLTDEEVTKIMDGAVLLEVDYDELQTYRGTYADYHEQCR